MSKEWKITATAAATAPTSIIFPSLASDQPPTLELRMNGDIYVKGRLVENDAEVVQGMRDLLAGRGLYAAPAAPAAAHIYAGSCPDETAPDQRDPKCPACRGMVAPAAPAAEPVGQHCYVQPVPDHCDRILWRGFYYHLPKLPAATPAAGYCIAAPGTQGAPILLHDYAGLTEHEVMQKVLARASREGFRGAIEERMRVLGWQIVPIGVAGRSEAAATRRAIVRAAAEIGRAMP